MNRLTMMATAIGVMEAMHREGHTVKSALADLQAPHKPGRSACWEDVVKRIFTLLEADYRGKDMLVVCADVPPGMKPDAEPSPEPIKPKIVRLSSPVAKRPVRNIVRAQQLDGPVVFDDARKTAGRA